ncbi:helix-turn-helix transcriptional regulator [Xaviernesmea oryzae]|uniref:Helix-turn-helix transcriptional regulator n=1 Tax=Xaviernesmea oryzae TaxID=464029 RepID=A0A1Q9AS37_9HYPH|nr:helix-turn-helix transcriptional regulator [Xaviernesmea oryzae]OLP58199.1 helix-turn-helix transcriptional regulator [Xaviernesmea oryzae]SEL46897.1 DNA-binding transcriptional regulator, CsgD family [Xaviernesmea oryzae]
MAGTPPGMTSGSEGGKRAARISSLITRLQQIQRALGGRNFAVLRLSGSGLPGARKLTCVLDNWGAHSEAMAHNLLSAYSDAMLQHIDGSILPLVWNGTAADQIADVTGFESFTRRLIAGGLSQAGIAFPVRLGAQGNGYVVVIGGELDLNPEAIIDLHGQACQVLTDLLAADERRMLPAEALSEREIDCLQMAGNGHISEDIAEKMGLSVHTVNAYLGAATTKLDSVNRIQAIAKAIRLGYIR